MMYDQLFTAACARAGLVLLCLGLFAGWSTNVTAQSLSVNATMNFGKIDFSNPPISGNITMGTNGSISYATNTDGPGIGTPGEVVIGGTAGTIVDIQCGGTATLALGASTVEIDPVKITLGGGAAYGSATDCGGIGVTVLSHTLTGNALQNTLFLGGRLVLNMTTPVNGEYTSSAGGGADVAIQVVIQ